MTPAPDDTTEMIKELRLEVRRLHRKGVWGFALLGAMIAAQSVASGNFGSVVLAIAAVVAISLLAAAFYYSMRGLRDLAHNGSSRPGSSR